MLSPMSLKTYCLKRDVFHFSKEILGITLHPGQAAWTNNSWKLINILKPANQWGKTLVESVIHIFHAVTKVMLLGRVSDDTVWEKILYETANVGKTYEVAKGVFETVQDVVEGRILLPDGHTNDSLLKGWAIADLVEVANRPPEILWWNNSKTLIRSYDEFGSAFKRKRLAFVSGDECGDIPELKLFLNGTLLPRVAFFQGPIHLVGTSQPAGVEYEELAEVAEKEHKKDSALYYFQTGSIYENPNLDKEFLQQMEEVADPELRKQIIYGQYVDYRDHFFNYHEANQMFSHDLDYDAETGIIEEPDPKGYYIATLDVSASKDDTVFAVLRYNRKATIGGQTVELPYKVVFYKAFRGETMPLSLQYEMVKNWFGIYKSVSPNTRFTFDGQSLGGKGIAQALSSLHGYPFPPSRESFISAKGEALGILKEVLGRGRRFTTDEKGDRIDENNDWGFIRASWKLFDLRKQFEMYRLKDDNIKQDGVMAIMQAIYFIEKRKPRLTKPRVMDFNIYRAMIGRSQ